MTPRDWKPTSESSSPSCSPPAWWRCTTNSVRRFLGLDAQRKRAAVLAAPAALYVRTTLGRHGYGGVRDRLAARSRPVAHDLADAQQTARIAEAVMRRLPAAPTCLVRSLVVWWLVGGDDIALVRLGVAPGETGEAPKFHAWVEIDGVPINDAADVSERYRPFEAAVPPVTGFD